MLKGGLKFYFLLVVVVSVFFTISFVSAGELRVTEEHPFLINGSWIDASQLKVGDELTLVNGTKVIIKQITDVETENPFLVYNLEAGEYHNFVVGEDGVVVHNSGAISSRGIKTLNVNSIASDVYESDGTVSTFFGLFKSKAKNTLSSGEYVDSLTKTRGLSIGSYIDDIGPNKLDFIQTHLGLSGDEAEVVGLLLRDLEKRRVSIIFADDFSKMTGAGACFSPRYNVIIMPKSTNPRRFLVTLGHEYYHSLGMNRFEHSSNVLEDYIFSKKYQRFVRLKDTLVDLSDKSFIDAKDVVQGTLIKISPAAAAEINSEVFAEVFIDKVYNPSGESFVWPERLAEIFKSFSNAKTHSHLGWEMFNSQLEPNVLPLTSKNLERLRQFTEDAEAYIQLRPPISDRLADALALPNQPIRHHVDLSKYTNKLAGSSRSRLYQSWTDPVTRAYKDVLELMKTPIH